MKYIGFIKLIAGVGVWYLLDVPMISWQSLVFLICLVTLNTISHYEGYKEAKDEVIGGITENKNSSFIKRLIS